MKKVIIITGSIIVCVAAILIGMFTMMLSGNSGGAGKPDLVFSTPDATAVYNGQALTATEWNLETGTLKKGHIAEVRVTGIQTEAGTSKNKMSVSIVNGKGKDVSGEYSINTKEGTLTVTPIKIEVIAKSTQKIYDGMPLKCDSFDVLSGSLLEGHNFTPTYFGEQTTVGNSACTVSLVITDTNGVDVSANYNIVNHSGVLTVLKRHIVIKSGSEEKIYSGTPLSNNKITIVEGSLVADHVFVSNFSGRLTNVGEITNNFVVVIKNTSGADLTLNYDITYVFGTLRVLPAQITVITDSDSKIYDGQPLTCETYKVMSGDLANGESLSVSFLSSARDIGKYENKASFAVKNSEGQDTTKNYVITVVNGILEIFDPSHTIVLKSKDAVKIYDGTPLKNEDLEIFGELFEGHSIEVNVTGEQIAAGESENSFTFKIVDMDGNNVTENYTVLTTFGTLTVTKRNIVVSSENFVAIYDGTPKSSSLTNVYGEVADGEECKIALPQISIDVFSGLNILQVWIERNGVDVSENYNITCHEGNFAVLPIEITLQSGSAWKLYDGVALTNGEWTQASSQNIPAKDNLNVYVIGSRLSVGRSDNIFVVTIEDKETGESVINNYEINKVYGELLVVGSDNGGGGNLSGQLPGFGATPTEPRLVLRLKSSKDGSIYMRSKSFGDYTGTGWEDAVAYNVCLDGTYSFNYLTSIALKNEQYAKVELEVENYSNERLLPYYLVMNDEGSYGVVENDVTFGPNQNPKYNAQYYQYLGTSKDILKYLDQYSDDESFYYQFVKSNYLYVDDKTLDCMTKIIAEKNFDPNDADIIAKVAKYIQGAAKYNLEYDIGLDREENIVVAFLENYKEGVCRHYASAAVLLYRALGIPARYTVGYVGSTKSDQWIDIDSEKAHAWVEVYIEGCGWIMVEVTGSSSDGVIGDGTGDGTGGGNLGDFEESKIEISVTPKTEYYQYNGLAQTHSGKVNVTSKDDRFNASDYVFEATVDGDRKAPGWNKAVSVTEFHIYNKSGEEVTDKFSIAYKKGKMQIYIDKVKITTGSAEKVYDGIEMTIDEFEVDKTLLGLNIEVTAKGKLKNVGSTANTFSAIITDSSGNDVTDQYYVEKVYGKLKVTARTINIEISSAEKIFDGSPLICKSYSLANGTSLTETDMVKEIAIVGSQTGVGQSSNILQSITIINKETGEDVTKNYKIEYTDGMLTVLPPA